MTNTNTIGFKPLALLCFAAMLSACAGSLQQTPTVPGTHSSLVTQARGRRKGQVVMRVTIPKKRHHHRKRDFISPSTQSMTYSITGASSASGTVNLTPTSTGCTSTLASTICQLTLILAPGSYNATITTYDGLNGTGNALSTAQSVSFTVVAGTSNAISLTLSGIPASLIVLPDSATSGTNLSGAINLTGTAASKLLIEALDADGNVILGAGSPSFSVKAVGGFSVTLTQPASPSGNTFTITPPSAYKSGSAVLAVTASYSGQATDGCAQAGAVCIAYVSVVMQQLLAAISGNSVDLFTLGNPAPFTTLSGLSSPRALAFDGSGNLYVANTGTNTIAIYAPPYNGTPQALSVTDPVALAFDGSGNLDVASYSGNTIARYAPPITSASSAAATTSSGIIGPDALAINGSNLFVANSLANTVLGFSTSFSNGDSATTNVGGGTGISAPNALAFDGNNRLYVSNSVSGCNSVSSVTVKEYSSPYTGSATSFGTANVNCPVGVTVTLGGTKRVFIANSSAGSIDAVTVFTTGASYQSTLAAANPTALAIDGGNDVLVGSSNANAITLYGNSSGFALQLTMPNVTSPTAMAVLP
jgi:hypothetical protein